MTGVLVVGASGYIGNTVARALRRDGYTVYAQSRNATMVGQFYKEELIPLICDPTDAAALKGTVERCQFIIDCTSTITDGKKIPNSCLDAIRSCESNTNKHYIFTSGILVYGDTDEPVNEEMPRTHPMVAERIQIEDMLLDKSMDVNCTVIRPGMVYGKSGGSVAPFMLFQPIDNGEGKIKIPGNPKRRWSWVHVEDLAESYLLVLHNSKVAAGRAYDIAESFGPTYEEVKVEAAKAMGYSVSLIPEYVEAEEILDKLANVTVVISGKRARDELGWVPKHTGVLNQMSQYYMAYKQSK